MMANNNSSENFDPKFPDGGETQKETKTSKFLDQILLEDQDDFEKEK